MKTHWKQLVNIDYLGVYSLPEGQDMTIKILSVSKQAVKGENGKQEDCMVATIEKSKPFIINRTNAKTIQAVLDSAFIEDWIGKSITIFASTTKLKGENVECLRVRPVVPKLQKDELLPTNLKHWQNVLGALKNGKSIQDIEIHYFISEENKTRLEYENI